MVMPIGAESFSEGLRWGGDLPCVENCIKEKGYSTNVGDEGGFAPKHPEQRRSYRNSSLPR